MSELDRWEARFGGPHYAFGKEPAAFLKAQASRLPASGKALSVADGEGRNGVWLAERGLDVRAIDFSPAGLQKSRALAAERGVTLAAELADVTTWRWPAAAYDVIVAIFIQFVTPVERSKLFTDIKNALKPGGLLLLHGYRPEQLRYGTGGPQEADRMYTRELLEASFGDMTQLEIFEHDSIVNEGSSHVGMSALIDLIATK